MPTLSVFIIVKDEERDLPGCLESIKGLTEEVVVVDSGSTDQTLQMAKKAGARVFERPMDGFAAQKQFALEQCRGDWLLSIDADERVTRELAASIRKVVTPAEAGAQSNGLDAGLRRHDGSLYAGYRLTREMFFLGQRLRFGGVGQDKVIRFFQKGKGRFRPVKVHESIEIDGTIGELPGVLSHYSYASLEEYLQKRDHYTTLAAEDLWRKGRRFHWTDYLRPAWELLNRVVLRGAWLDGRPGLRYATLSAATAWQRSKKLWQLEKSKKS